MTLKELGLIGAAGTVVLVGIASFYDASPRYVDSPMTSVMTSVSTQLPEILPTEPTVLPPLQMPEVVFSSTITEIAAPLPEIVFEDTLPEILPPLTEFELPPLQGEV